MSSMSERVKLYSIQNIWIQDILNQRYESIDLKHVVFLVI